MTPFLHNLTITAARLRNLLLDIDSFPQMISGTNVTDPYLFINGNRISVQVDGQDSGPVAYNQECSGAGDSAGISDVIYFTCQVTPQVFISGFYSGSGRLTRLAVDGRLRDKRIVVGKGRTVEALELGIYNGATGTFTGGRRMAAPSGSYIGFGKKVTGGNQPSINQIMMVPANGGAGWAQSMPSSSGDQNHVLQQGSGAPVPEAFYMVWTGPPGREYTTEEFRMALRVMVEGLPDVPAVRITATSTTLSTTATQSTSTDTVALLQPLDSIKHEFTVYRDIMVQQMQETGWAKILMNLPDDRVLTLWKLNYSSSDAANTVTDKDLTFHLGNGRYINVFVPRAALLALPSPPVEPDEVAIYVGLVNKTKMGFYEEENVLTAVEIDLVYVEAGDQIKAEDLPEPVVFTMPANSSAAVTCEYYDFDRGRWSVEGTQKSPKNVDGKDLICETNHLSFFGALFRGFLDTFLCGQFALFNMEALGRVWHRYWHGRQGTLIFSLVLLMLAATFAVAAYMDRRRGEFPDEFFMIPLFSGPPGDGEVRDRVSVRELESSTSYKKPLPFYLACLYFIGRKIKDLCVKLKGSSAVRDAVDDIMSNWCEKFGEIRSLCEGCYEGMDPEALCVCSADSLVNTSYDLMINMTLSTSKKMSGATLGMSDDLVSFVLEDEVLSDILRPAINEVDRVVEAMTVFVKAKETWTRLHHEIGTTFHRQIAGCQSWRHFPAVILKLFIVHTPFGTIWVFDAFLSCKMRAFYFAVEVTGAMLLCALFFQASGSVASVTTEDIPSCDVPRDGEVAYRIGRLIAIGIGSTFISGIPVNFLESLHERSFRRFEFIGCETWQKQLRIWRTQDRMVWFLGGCYFLFSVFFCILFFANIGDADHSDFATAEITSVVQDCILIPACVSISGPLIAAFLLSFNSWVMKKAKSELIRMVQHQAVQRTNLMLPITSV